MSSAINDDRLAGQRTVPVEGESNLHHEVLRLSNAGRDVPAGLELRLQPGLPILRQFVRVSGRRTERRRGIDDGTGHGLTLWRSPVEQRGLNAIEIRLHLFALPGLLALAGFLAFTGLFALPGFFELLGLFFLFRLLAPEGFRNRIRFGLWFRRRGLRGGLWLRRLDFGRLLFWRLDVGRLRRRRLRRRHLDLRLGGTLLHRIPWRCLHIAGLRRGRSRLPLFLGRSWARRGARRTPSRTQP